MTELIYDVEHTMNDRLEVRRKNTLVTLELSNQPTANSGIGTLPKVESFILRLFWEKIPSETQNWCNIDDAQFCGQFVIFGQVCDQRGAEIGRAHV